jgi:hypothetical protein
MLGFFFEPKQLTLDHVEKAFLKKGWFFAAQHLDSNETL